jgi:hypothetical protein
MDRDLTDRAEIPSDFVRETPANLWGQPILAGGIIEKTGLSSVRICGQISPAMKNYQ